MVRIKGFTLIEVLVVIAMISLLVVGLIIAINPTVQLQKTRDGRRKSDIRLIQTALQLYRADQGGYPDSIPNFFATGGRSLVDDPSNVQTTYIQNVPKDPLTGTDYYYDADSPPGGYSIYSCLETKSDPDALTDITIPAAPDPVVDADIISALNCPAGSLYYGVINP